MIDFRVFDPRSDAVEKYAVTLDIQYNNKAEALARAHGHAEVERAPTDSNGAVAETDAFLADAKTEEALDVLVMLCDPEDPTLIDEDRFVGILVTWKQAR